MFEGPDEAFFEELAELAILDSPILRRLSQANDKVYISGFSLENLLEHGVQNAFKLNDGAKARVARIIKPESLLS